MGAQAQGARPRLCRPVFLGRFPARAAGVGRTGRPGARGRAGGPDRRCARRPPRPRPRGPWCGVDGGLGHRRGVVARHGAGQAAGRHAGMARTDPVDRRGAAPRAPSDACPRPGPGAAAEPSEGDPNDLAGRDDRYGAAWNVMSASNGGSLLMKPWSRGSDAIASAHRSPLQVAVPDSPFASACGTLTLQPDGSAVVQCLPSAILSMVTKPAPKADPGSPKNRTNSPLPSVQPTSAPISA